jgi:hypothetical protein
MPARSIPYKKGGWLVTPARGDELISQNVLWRCPEGHGRALQYGDQMDAQSGYANIMVACHCLSLSRIEHWSLLGLNWKPLWL